MSSNSSDNKQSKGGSWTKTLYFTPNAKEPGYDPVSVSDNDLNDYFQKVEGTSESIEKVMIFKNNLSNYFPKWFGAWHEFTVVESKYWYWSFEKDSKGILVQRSKSLDSLKNNYRGEERTGSVVKEGRDDQNGKGDTIQNIFLWLYRKDYLNQGYHLTESNCHYFASLLFEAIARQKDRKLLN